jgi:hypothetical protein
MTGLEITRCSIVYTKQIFNDWFFPTFLAVVLSILHMRSKSNLLISIFPNKLKDYRKTRQPSLLLLFRDPGSGMGKNQDPGSGINIPDPPHCPQHWKNIKMAYFKKL